MESRIMRLVAVVVALLACCSSAGSTHAQTALRWKLQPGEVLKYEFQQQSQSQTSGAGKPQTIQLDMTLRLTWQVETVNEQGVATVVQTIEGLSMSMKMEKLDPIVYDSAARAPTSGPAKEIAEGLSVLVGAKSKLQFSPRGEVLSSEPSKELQAAWEKSAPGQVFSAEGLSRVLKQSFLVLPAEPVQAGAKWEASTEVESPYGPLQLSSQYTYVGSEPREGKPTEKIDSSTDIKLAKVEEGKGPSVTLSDSKQTGSLWFDAERGRFVSSQLQQTLVSQRPFRDKTIRVQTTTTMAMKLVP